MPTDCPWASSFLVVPIPFFSCTSVLPKPSQCSIDVQKTGFISDQREKNLSSSQIRGGCSAVLILARFLKVSMKFSCTTFVGSKRNSLKVI